jgi:uncharacterized lipoprotein YmbA
VKAPGVVSALLALSAAMLLVSCKSVPMRYYTLTPADRAAAGDGNPQSPVTAILVMHPVPGAIDTTQLLIRADDTQMRVEENARWVAPFADEVKAAFIDSLRRRSGILVLATTGASSTQSPRIVLNLQKFDAIEGSTVSIVADWSVTMPGEGRTRSVSCLSVFSTKAPGALDGVVAASQAAVMRLADDVASAVKALAAGAPPPCP